MEHGRLWAAIFDWDGVIVDSSRRHEESWERLSAEEGRSLPDGYFHAGFGMKNDVIIPELLGWSGDPEEIRRLSLRKEELYRQIVLEKGIKPLPGTKRWLEMLREQRIPCVIASSTHRKNIEQALEIIDFGSFFADIISAEDVTRGKPDPDVFLTAARRIGKSPSECIVFEDAPAGIEAAHRAGIMVVGISTTHAAYTLADADIVVETLDDLGFHQVQDAFNMKGADHWPV